MVKREGVQNAIRPGLLLRAMLCWVVVELAALLCIAMLMQKQIIGSDNYLWWSRLSLVLASACSAAFVCLRTKLARLPVCCLATSMCLIIVLPLVLLCGEGERPALAALADIILSLISNMLVCAVAAKSTKNRKKKKLHK